jgi:hypothetical protein
MRRLDQRLKINLKEKILRVRSSAVQIVVFIILIFFI